MKRIGWMAVACICCMLMVGSVWAYQGKIKMGKVSVIPGVSLVEEYDDNIYLGNGDNDTTEKKESDWITHIKPSLVFLYDMMNRGQISLGYLGDFAMYSSNGDNDWNSHTIAFKSDYKAPAGLLVGLNNTYINADDPYASENDYKLGEQTKRWSDDLNFKLGYQFVDKFRVIGYYNFYKQDYDLEQDYSQDYDNNEVGLGAEMKVMPQTWAFVRYFHGARDYTNHPAFIPRLSDETDADFTYNRVNVGLGWDATAKLSGEFNVGYQWNSADNEFDPYGRAYEDKDTWVAQTKVTYLASPKTKIGGDLFRAVRYTGGDLSEFY
ncbi:MAG: outer membrane beta-barrel protein, partial [Chloroflexota bacterium]